jgi:hypothetical protein
MATLHPSTLEEKSYAMVLDTVKIILVQDFSRRLSGYRVSLQLSVMIAALFDKLDCILMARPMPRARWSVA